MKDYFDYLFFGIYPYLAIVICVLVSWIRYEKFPYSWRVGSSLMMTSDKMTRWGFILMHVGIVGVLFGHIVGLFTPESIVLSIMTKEQHQLLAMVAGGTFGVIALAGFVLLLYRRLTNVRIKKTQFKGDLFILSLLVLQCITGLSTLPESAMHMNGQMITYSCEWIQYLYHLDVHSAVIAMSHVPVIIKIHVVLGLTMIASIPFTRLIHIISVPLQYFKLPFQIIRR